MMRCESAWFSMIRALHVQRPATAACTNEAMRCSRERCALTHTHTHTHTCKYTHLHTHTCIYTHLHTHTLTHTHTHTHTHTPWSEFITTTATSVRVKPTNLVSLRMKTWLETFN